MNIVLDASAAVEVVLNRKKAREFSELLSEADSVVVPSLFTAEVTNVFWKYYKFHDMPLNECEQYLQTALLVPDEAVDMDDMGLEVLQTAALTGMTAYDMFYMVLARRLNAKLMTLDKNLKKSAQKHGVKVV